MEMLIWGRLFDNINESANEFMFDAANSLRRV